MNCIFRFLFLFIHLFDFLQQSIQVTFWDFDGFIIISYLLKK